MKSLFKLIERLKEQCTKQQAIYIHRYKSRRALLKLDVKMLKDIGISSEQAKEEGNRPFWEGDSLSYKRQDTERLKQNRFTKKRFKKASRSGGVSF